MSIFENMNIRNLVIAMVSGFLFSTGWWIFIDVAATYPEVLAKHKLLSLPGLCSTAAMIIVLITPYRTSPENYFYAQKCHPFATMTILFVALVFSFGFFIWALYIWINDFLLGDLPAWPGVGIMLQNLFILITNLQLKFARQIEDV